MTDFTVRAAVAADHPTFVRLFPELEVEDPILDADRFATDIVPTALIAEAKGEGPVGYLYFTVMQRTLYIRHVIAAPTARRRGVGRALMNAAAERARSGDAPCTDWCLNVKPNNVAAITLYERLGLVRAFESRAMKIDWAQVAAATAPDPPEVTVRGIAPEDDARVEAATNLVGGQLANARTMPDRVLLMLEEPSMGKVVGAAIFHPHFPGAYPFRVARPALALTLLRAIRPHARPEDVVVNVVVEEDLTIADALLALGASVKLEILHMKGHLPAAP
jgi:GNAT superfamily N-acetyltransferase